MSNPDLSLMEQEHHAQYDSSSYVLDCYYRPKARAHSDITRDSASVENACTCDSLREEIANLKMQLSECQHVVNVQKSALSAQKEVLDTKESELAQLRNEHEELINDMHDVYEIHQINEDLRIDLEASRNREVSLALLCSKIARERDRITEELEDEREKNVHSRHPSINLPTRKLKPTAEERLDLETKMVDLMWQRHELSQKVEILSMNKNNSTVDETKQEIAPDRPIPQGRPMLGGRSISEKILGKNRPILQECSRIGGFSISEKLLGRKNEEGVREEERPMEDEDGTESLMFHGGGGPEMKRGVGSSPSPQGYSRSTVETTFTSSTESRSSLTLKDAKYHSQVDSNVPSSKFSRPIQSFFPSLLNAPPSPRSVPLASSNSFDKTEMRISNSPSA